LTGDAGVQTHIIKLIGAMLHHFIVNVPKKGGILCTLLFSGFVFVKQMILPLPSPGDFLSELGIMII